MGADKTGTLTEGEPRMTDVRPSNGVDERELLRIAVAVEDVSTHPLAKAIVRDGKSKLEKLSVESKEIPVATNLKSITVPR